MNLFDYLIPFALALGVLILVHELGHYLVARACGVKVLRFSIGFGKALLVRRGGRDEAAVQRADEHLAAVHRDVQTSAQAVRDDDRFRQIVVTPARARFSTSSATQGRSSRNDSDRAPASYQTRAGRPVAHRRHRVSDRSSWSTAMAKAVQCWRPMPPRRWRRW